MNSTLKELFEERQSLVNYAKKKNNVIEVIMDICSCLFTFEFPLFIGSVILYIADGLIRIKYPNYTTNNAGLQGVSFILLIMFFVILSVIISGIIIDYIINRKFYEERRKIVKYYSGLAKKEKEKQYKKLDKIYKRIIK
jgi:hypothetical protein